MFEFRENGKLEIKVITIVTICVIAFVVLFNNVFSYEKVLVIEDVDNKCRHEFLIPDREFVLGYIHSVELTPAEEFFHLEDDNTLMLEKTVYKSFGVGLPFSQEKWDFVIEDGKFILDINRSFDSVKIRVSPIPKHWLEINGKKYELIDLVAKPDDLVDIYATNKWVFAIGKLYNIIF